MAISRGHYLGWAGEKLCEVLRAAAQDDAMYSY